MFTPRGLDLVLRRRPVGPVVGWVLLGLLLTGPTILPAQETDPVEETYTALDAVDFGEQLVGERLSRYDLTGQVVVCYHWCITCPLSTGAFPHANHLARKYRDRGVRFIGFQVQREPALETNNVVYYLEYLKPEFPVTRRGFVTAWPVKYLPWAVVFDHRGEKVFADNLPGLEKAIQAALAEAPDYLVGGPYTHLGAAAERMARDREHLGEPLAALRHQAANPAAEPALRDEARRLIACVERHYRRQVAKAEEDAEGPVERAAIYARLAGIFHGDRLGEQAAAEHRRIAEESTFARERDAQAELDRARAAFRKLPPAGRYTYDMRYLLVREPEHVTRRARMIAAYQAALRRVESVFPRTHAAGRAADLRLDVDVPEIEPEAARTILAAARATLQDGAATAYARYDAYLALYHVVHGYFHEDATAEAARSFHDTWIEKNAQALDQARIVHERLTRDATRTEDAVRAGGSGLTPDEAAPLVKQLEQAAAEAGPGTRLAREIGVFTAALTRSLAGPASLGVAFTRGQDQGEARIRWVYPRSAASRAGLRPGDVIVFFDGLERPTPAALRQALNERKPGQRVRVRVRRESSENRVLECSVILGRKN